MPEQHQRPPLIAHPAERVRAGPHLTVRLRPVDALRPVPRALAGRPDVDDPLKPVNRGNSAKDWYYYGGLTLSYKINGAGQDRYARGGRRGKNIGCPTNF